MIDTQTYRGVLLARLRELDHRLADIEHALDEPAPQDFEDRATEREDDEMLEHLGEAGLLEIKQIRAALGRVRDGSYGTCVRCGAAILPERLITLPHTPLCRNCAHEIEGR